MRSEDDLGLAIDISGGERWCPKMNAGRIFVVSIFKLLGCIFTAGPDGDVGHVMLKTATFSLLNAMKRDTNKPDLGNH